MEIAVSQGQAIGAARPALDIWTHKIVKVGVTPTAVNALAAPYSITWAIASIADEDEAPAAVASGTVDLTADKVDGITGHYAAAVTIPSGAPLGRAQITWTVTLDNGGRPVTMVREFDILRRVPEAPAYGYGLVSDLREQEITKEMCSDQRAIRLIADASRYFERCTGRYFEPRYKNTQHDGSGGRALQLEEPLIALESVSLGNPPLYPVGMESLRPFNRHITEGLTQPDDRDDPKLEFIHFKDVYGRQRSPGADSPIFGVPFRDLYFPAGVLNVNVVGLFGYTDPDGSLQGATPPEVRRVIAKLVYRDVPKLTDPDRDSVRDRNYLTSERTRDQSYTRNSSQEGAFTGDREIDDVILRFMRPMQIGGA